MSRDVTMTKLDNGLTVILKEIHTAPVVSTWLWYRVGSRNEVEGATGLSHWVEHMMFKGSPRFPKGAVMRAVDRYGGYVNAMTSHDFTAYYATLPSQHAELALEIEADRMASARFDPQEVEAERTVILSEREGNENQPSYVLAEEMTAVAFHVHPYHHQTIGWKEDLHEITREQLYEHYRRYYVPNNAILVVVGDVDASYLDVIEHHLGGIAAGPQPPQKARSEPPQRGERRVIVRLPGAGDLVRIEYHTPPVSHPDYVPLVVLDAVLSGGKAMFAFDSTQARSARLYRALVETDLASSVGSIYHPSLDPYLYTLSTIVRQGRKPQEVEDALLAQVARLQEEAVSQDELHVAIRQVQAQFAYSSESVTGQALTLGFLEIVDHHQRMNTVLDELAAVTPADVLRVAQTYWTPENRIVGWFLPTQETGAQPDIEADTVLRCISPRETLCFYTPPPAIGPDTVTRAVLDNGIVVLAQENPASPSVTIEVDLDAGGSHETDDQAGLALLTAQMVRRGTQTSTFQELNRALERVGASIDLSAGADEASLSARSLAADLPLLLHLLGDVLTQPTFPESELERVRGQRLTHLSILDSDTEYRAENRCMELLYPAGHPYARSPLGTARTIQALGRQDLVAFYRDHYAPGRLVLAIVGAIEAERAIEQIAQSALGAWQAQGAAPARHIPAAQTPREPRVERIEIPAKSQVDLVWATVGMPRSSPDYYAARMGDTILGRLGLMGRLGARVRDEQGLAYYVDSSLSGGFGPQPWILSAGVHPDGVERALASILEEVRRLREEPIADDELADCRSFLTGSLPLALETNGGIAQFLLGIEAYALGLDYLARYPGLIAAVTKEDIQCAVRRYLTLDGYALAMAGTFSG